MNIHESKYFNTARKMDEALITLLEKKDFAYITVKEVCEVAEVNRSTFYLHYENTVDLLRETAQYVVEKHFSYYSLDLQDFALCLDQLENKNLLFISDQYLVPYLLFIKDNQRIFKVAVKHFDSMNMHEVYNWMFGSVFDPILAHFRIPEKQRPYMMKFYLTGVFAIVMEWLDGECTDDMDLIIQIIKECVMGERRIHE